MDLAAELRDNGGFTYDPRERKLIVPGDEGVRGYAIAIPGTEHEVNGSGGVVLAAALARFRRDHAAVLMNRNVFIGGWHSDERNVDIIELTEILDTARYAAIATGTARNQEGILDMRTGEYIPTGGMGDAEPWCNHDSAALREITVQVCECGAILRDGDVIFDGANAEHSH